MPIIIDAHEDIAWNTLCFGRDYLDSAYDIRRHEEDGPVEAVDGCGDAGPARMAERRHRRHRRDVVHAA